MSNDTTLARSAFDKLADTSDEGGLGPLAAQREAGSFLRHAASLSMTKTADGLIDPKLVLSWLLHTLGTSSFWIGLLVPLREAGALLPQLFTSERILAMRRRKWAWAAGSAVQGFAAAGTVLAGLTLEGRAAGVVVVALVLILALARSVCSVSYKDVLGKTVGKTRRGTVTGLASSVSAIGVALFALLLMTGIAPRFSLVLGAIALAATFWLLAAALFSTLAEDASDTRDPEGTFRSALAQMALLREDGQFVRFIAARGFLVGTALAPPFLVILAGEAGQTAFGQLGALVLASAGASLVSGYVWGRLADRSSRQVLMASGLAGAAALGLALAANATGLMGVVWVAPSILFILMLAYNGVRQGRSTYLVDMAPEDARATYTAVSNTVIGLALLASGVFGAIASVFGAEWTVGIFGLMSLCGALAAATLNEVQGT